MAKQPIQVTDRADAATTRNLALLRRLGGANVFGQGSRAIPMREAGRWKLYVANTYANENAMYDMREKGWEPVLPKELACAVEESGFRVSPDGFLVKGPQGQEQLWKMPVEDYRLLQQTKTAANMRGIGSGSQTKHDIANAAGAALGSEAGDFLHGLQGHVIDTITGGDVP